MADNSISGRSCGSRDLGDGRPHNPGVPVDVSRLLFPRISRPFVPLSLSSVRETRVHTGRDEVIDSNQDRWILHQM